MEENTNVAGTAEQPVNVEVPTAGEQAGTETQAAPAGTADTSAGKMFTQEEVNAIVQERLDKTYKKYGFEKADELDEAVGKSQSYEVMKERYGSTQGRLAELEAENALLKSHIDPSKYDDVRAYFKGKSLPIDADTLAKEAQGHPEWAQRIEPVTTVTPLGSDKDEGGDEDEDKKAAEMFGLAGFVD